MTLSTASSLSLRALLFGAIERAGLEPGPQHLSGVTPPAVAPAMPCNPCCFIGIGFGIWGIVVLCDPRVTQAMQ